jgi:hypothetical protein
MAESFSSPCACYTVTHAAPKRLTLLRAYGFRQQVGYGITEAQGLWITIQIRLMKLYLRFFI